MNMLVKAMTGQRFMVYADDDVAERYRAETTTPWQHREASLDPPAGNLDRAVDDSSLRSARKRNERKEQADARGRQCPSVSDDAKKRSGDTAHRGGTP
jgi:Lon protease-like protein